MRSSKWMICMTLTAIALGAFSSCGRASREDVLPIPAPIYPGPIPTPTYPIPTPTPTPTDGFLPAIAFSFSLTGANGTSPTFVTPPMDTDSILKVKVTAGPAQLNTGGSGFQGTYNCLSVNVTAIGQTVSTVNLSTSGAGTSVTGTTSQCPNAPNSQVIDFSNRLTPGHGPVAITVSAARYDYYCNEFWINYLYYGPYYSPYGSNPGLYCPMHVVYQNHVVTGNLDIQVNGTTLP